MEKMRIFVSLNTQIRPEKKMLHRSVKIRIPAKQCVNFPRCTDDQNSLHHRVKDLTSESSHNYYMAHLNAMQTELDQFTTTYANRI